MDFLLSIFLAKLIGSIFLIASLAVFIRTDEMMNLARDISKDFALNHIIGFLRLVAGLSIIISHNYWIDEWPIIITILGWLLFIFALLRFFMSKEMSRLMSYVANNKKVFVTIGVVIFIIGAYLAYQGFIK